MKAAKANQIMARNRWRKWRKRKCQLNEKLAAGVCNGNLSAAKA
jgi:hypothetical protein